MPDLNFVGRNLVTRNADGTYGQDLEENIVGIQTFPFRLTASQIGNADLAEVDLLPALGAEAFYAVHGIVCYPLANGGSLPASGTLNLIYGGTGANAVLPTQIPASGASVWAAGINVLSYDGGLPTLANVKNKTLAMTAATAIPIPGTIAASTVGTGGTGWAVNDLFNIISVIDASVIGTGRVTSVAAGVIDGYVILTSTLGAIRGDHDLAATTGVGINASIDVIGVNYATNAALIVGKLFYSTHSTVV